MVKLKLWVRVGESESPQKVGKAVANLFPGVVLEGGAARPDIENLIDLKNKIAARRIGKSMLRQIMKNLDGKKTMLMFNKQAAFAGKISLVESYEESPKGAIVLEFDWDDGFVAWLTGVEKNQLPVLSRR